MNYYSSTIYTYNYTYYYAYIFSLTNYMPIISLEYAYSILLISFYCTIDIIYKIKCTIKSNKS